MRIQLPVREASSSSKPAVKYPGKLHARRVAEQLGAECGLIYLAGQAERNLEDSDQPIPFRQRRYFFYLAGADFPGCHVTYDIAVEELVLWVPYVAPKDVLWFGSTPSPDECMKRFDVDRVCLVDGLESYVDEYRESHPSAPIYILDGKQKPRSDRDVFEDMALKDAMDRARVVKTEYEISMIRKANDISSAAHRAVASSLSRLRSERDVEAVFQATCTSHGTRTQAYPIIAGAGSNASTLHYDANDGSLEGRELLLLDAGCEWNCYASDVTRTMPVKGTFSPRAAAVYAVVREMQAVCIRAVRPGACFRCLHLLAADVALDGLLRLGVLRGERREICEAGTVAAFFPHGLGHHVGLEVHDVDGGKRVSITPSSLLAMKSGEESKTTRRKRTGLRPNMIVTVEPGIYFCRPYLEASFVHHPVHGRFIDGRVLEAFYPVGGVRIEDDILVTENGGENLTTAPKEEGEL
ncbi:hypothetical protein CP532_1356, partial [Ophiocordyceps camponoti-leonardi (nom. inval.)]